MKNYSIFEAKTHLSELLRRVKAGEEVIVTERGHPIARVISFKEDDRFEDRLHRLEEAGIIVPGTPAEGNELGLKGKPKPKAQPGALKRFLAERD